jgi:hypothetical protein
MINASINSPAKMWLTAGYGFDVSGLKFIFDPARSLNMDAALDLGSNLVTNGDFHDFTMENDANTLGHWIFDSYYDSQESGAGVIGQDWSDGTPSVGAELVPNGTFDSAITGWTAGNGSIEWVASAYSRTGLMKLTASSVSPSIYDGLSSAMTAGNYYLVTMSMYIESSNETVRPAIRFRNAVSEYPLLPTTGDFSSGQWYDLSLVYIPNGANDSIYLYLFDLAADEVVYIDNVSVKEITTTNPLIPMNLSNYNNIPTNDCGNIVVDSSLLTGSNPAYENGNALAFNGIDQFFKIPAAHADDFRIIATTGTDFTIEAWVKTPSTLPTTGSEYIMGKDVSSNDRWNFYITYGGSNQTVWFFSQEAGGTISANKAGLSLSADTWYHIAITRTTAAIEIYIDGVAQTPTVASNYDGSYGTSAAPLYIGSNRGTASYWSGIIAEVRYSDVARSAQDIMESYGGANGWILNGSGLGTTLENLSFSQQIQRVTSSDYIRYEMSSYLEVGALYRFEATMYNENGGNNCRAQIDMGSYNIDTGYQDLDGVPTTFVKYGRCDSTASNNILLWGANGSFANIYDSIKVQKVQNSMDDLFEDKSFVEDFSLGGQRLGDEEIENGSFDSESNWTLAGNAAISGGVVTLTGDGSTNHYFDQTLGFIPPVNELYLISYDVTANTLTGSANLKIYNSREFTFRGSDTGNNTYYIDSMLTVGHHSYYAYGLGSYNSIRPRTSSGCSGGSVSFDNFSIRKLDNGYHGRTVNSLEDDQPAHPSAIQFDGAADYIKHGDSLALGTSDFIISYWLQSTITASDQGVLSKGGHGAVSAGFMVFNDNGNAELWMGDGTSIFYQSGATGAVCDGAWNHIVHVVDRSGNVYTYINNELVATEDISSHVAKSITNGSFDLTIGAYNSATPSGYVTGFIGLIAVYVYDGNDGAPAALPATYETLVGNIYNWCLNNRFGYGTSK